MIHSFTLPTGKLKELRTTYWNAGKNSHIGHIAVQIVRLYFEAQNPQNNCKIVKDGTDLEVCCNGETKYYEVKGTAAPNMAYNQLKVSSQASHDALVNGTTLIRVTNVGKETVGLCFLQHGIDFELVNEPRWSVRSLVRKQDQSKP